MLHSGLIGLWHFDEIQQRLLALNTVPHGAPLEIHGAVFEPRRFGGALVLRRPYDYALGTAPGVLRAGAVSFWLRLDATPRAAEILTIQGTLSVLADYSEGTGLVAQIGDSALPSGQQIEPGMWRHVAVTFSPDGATLYLDGKTAAHDPKAKRGLATGVNRDEYLAVGALGEQFTPFAIDELAIFDRCLDEAEVMQLVLDDFEPAAAVRPLVQPRSIDAAEYLDPNDPTCGFQLAIDAAGPAGGEVSLPAGRYVLKRPLVLPSRLTLVGRKGQTILAAPSPKGSTLAAHAAAESLTVRVEDPSVFAVGDAVTIRSDTLAQWQATLAIVESIKAGVLRLSRPLSAGCMTYDNGMIVTWSPLITATRRHGVHVVDLVLHGTPQAPEHIKPFDEPVMRTCPAVHLVDCVETSVQRCSIDGWPHDGIGVHGGARIRVTDSAATDCLGHGMSVDEHARLTQWLGNRAERNGMSGMFVGDQVRDSIVANSIFNGNKGYGIGGMDDVDCVTNLVTSNHCLGNNLGPIEHAGQSDSIINNLCNGPAKPSRLIRRFF